MHKYFAPPGGGRCPVTVDSTGQRAPHRARRSAMGLALATIAAGAAAQSHPTADARKAVELDPVEIRGHYDNSVGSSDAASGGVITPQLIEDRPLLRPGNLLEYVPGMVVTQHSGAGKANQYFLRGFNLDHGTDFSTWVAGMPVNLRTHGHGQGYSDLNFIIPELISGVDYWKGPYYANIGDFSSAGGASMRYFDSMKERVALATGGDYGYARGLLAGSAPAGSGVVTYGLELLHNDGPWEVRDHFRKYNAVLRYTRPLGEGKFSAKILRIDDLPLFNEDLEKNFPAEATRFKKEIESADAVSLRSVLNDRSTVVSSVGRHVTWPVRPNMSTEASDGSA